MPTPVWDQVAAALPGYDLGGELGRGGFGLVLAARHRLMGRDVAVKVLLDSTLGDANAPAGDAYGSDADLRTRFLQETRVLARLDHPHILRVYDYVEHAGLYLLVMEQLTGGSLRSRVATAGGIDPRATCAIGLAAASALAAAHDIGVLHRDVKPDNILFGADALPRMTDFGIAKIVESTVATTTGLVGTPRYMAPEQIEGAHLGPGTDIYALGVVLYELLAGQPVFPRGLALPALLHHHLAVAPQPMPDVPGPLAQVVLASLAKNPAERPGSAHDLALWLAAAAAAVFGPGWLAASGIPVRLPEDVLSAAAHRLGDSPSRAGQTSATTPWPATSTGGWPQPGSALTPPATPSRPVAAGRPTQAFTPPQTAASPGAGWPVVPAAATADPVLTPTRRERWQRTRRPVRRAIIAGCAAGLVLVLGFLSLVITQAVRGARGQDASDAYAGEAHTLALGSEGIGAIAIAHDGSLVLAAPGSGSDDGAVYVLSPDGTTHKVAGRGPATGTAPSSTTPARNPSPFPAQGVKAVDLVLGAPSAVVEADDGTIYVADSDADRVYRITPKGEAFLFAGIGEDGDGFDGDGQAVKAALHTPTALALDEDGALYLGESHQIRKITEDGLIHTVAGDHDRDGDEAGDGGPATAATLGTPSALAIDDDDALYVADYDHSTVRKIDNDGVITLVAGTPGVADAGGDGKEATKARLNQPLGLAIGDDGDLFIADTENALVRRVTDDGVIRTYAGTDDPTGLDGALATEADLGGAHGVAVDPSGALYVSLEWNSETELVRIDPDNQVVSAVLTRPAGT